MRRLFALALMASLAGCNCPRLGPCAPVDLEGWTSIFSSWGRHDNCDDCCPYGGCKAGRYYGPPADPRQLYRYTDDASTPDTMPPLDSEGILPMDPDAVPPPPTMNVPADGATALRDLNT